MAGTDADKKHFRYWDEKFHEELGIEYPLRMLKSEDVVWFIAKEKPMEE